MNNSRPKGWVRFHRSIEDWEFWFSEPFTRAQAWIDLFAFANHVRGTFMLRGNVITVERGEVAWSEATMGSRWKWSRSKVRRFLKTLETIQQIKIQRSFLCNKILILNYEKMQSDDTTDDTTNVQQTYNKRYTNKNEKNEKNEKKNTKNKFIPVRDENRQVDQVGDVFRIFYETINPQINFGNKTWRNAAQDLISQYGFEETLALSRMAVSIQGQAYAPVITNPYQLREKLAQLQIFVKKINLPPRGAIQSL